LQEEKPKGVGRLARIIRLGTALTLALFVTTATLDLVGRLLSINKLWVIGAYAAVAGVTVGGVVWIGLWVLRRPRGRVMWLIAVLLIGLAQFLRGSVGVPPDPPLVGAEWIAGFLAFAASRKRQRQKPENQIIQR
jgi:hypothetical protein